jgi:hypothetical protein
MELWCGQDWLLFKPTLMVFPGREAVLHELSPAHCSCTPWLHLLSFSAQNQFLCMARREECGTCACVLAPLFFSLENSVSKHNKTSSINLLLPVAGENGLCHGKSIDL